MKRFLKTTMLTVCLGVILCGGAPVEAQTIQTFSISDGTVTINGQEIPAADLPESLDLRGINANYTFIGETRPLIELRGGFYVLDGQRLRTVKELHDDEGGIEVYFRKDADDAEGVLVERFGNTSNNALFSSELAREQSQLLQQQTQELERLSQEVGQGQANQALNKARVQVAQAAQAVQLLPRLEVQSYLSDVQQYNQALYELLVKEWRMEREAERLALQIRALPEGPLRSSHEAELHDTLLEIFELKQDNRRREIQQLEQQLAALRNRLQKREDWRERLIRQRMDQLIGAPASPNHR